MEIREFLKEIGFAPEFVDLIQKASISFDFKELQSYRERRSAIKGSVPTKRNTCLCFS